MDVENFRALYMAELQEACSVEAQLIQALPRMTQAAHAPQLKQVIQKCISRKYGAISNALSSC
jgi:ferritin-like metal-binding protein YciE